MLKTLALTTALALLSTVTMAQGHATLADQRACYDQAQRYVRDQQQNNTEVGELLTFKAAHYIPSAHVCLVEYSDIIAEGDTPVESGRNVDDAFEGTNYASFMQNLTHPSDLPVCYVGKSLCHNADSFDEMLRHNGWMN